MDQKRCCLPQWMNADVGLLIMRIGLGLCFVTLHGGPKLLAGPEKWTMIGGAMGNLHDRMLYGEVIDFLHFRLWGGYSWPDFNLADSFIVTGVAVLILDLLAAEGEERVRARDTAADG